MLSTSKRVIRAALYDALQSVAEKFGGIGSGEFYFNQDKTGFADGPVCLIGLLHYVGAVGQDVQVPGDLIGNTPVDEATRALFGFSWATSDVAVDQLRSELGLPPNREDRRNSAQPRVPFKKWAEYFNIQRAVELPAPVYDALKASAEKFGGIGADRNFQDGGVFYVRYIEDPFFPDTYTTAAPYCATGHLKVIDGKDDGESLETVRNALGGVPRVNDPAVHTINKRKGAEPDARVSFAEWADELNVVRVAVLAPNVYDALKASAEKFGGIGADAFDVEAVPVEGGYLMVPYCVAGHAVFHDSDGAETIPGGGGTPTLLALQKAFNRDFFYEVYDVNDQAVFAINERKDAPMDARVSFAEWAQELRVVRGDA